MSHLGNSGTQRVMAEPEGKPVQGNQDASVLECSLGSVAGTNARRHAGGCGENSWLGCLLGSHQPVGVVATLEGARPRSDQ